MSSPPASSFTNTSTLATSSIPPIIAATHSDITPDTGELAEFRQKWKEELRDREKEKGRNRGGKMGGVSNATAKALGTGIASSESAAKNGQRLPGKSQDIGLRASMSILSGRTTDVQVGTSVKISNVPEVSSTQPAQLSLQRPQRQPQLPDRLKSALALYTNAILEEQKGNYAEATSLYRRAFRLNSNVDKVHHREEAAREKKLLNSLENESASSVTASVSAGPSLPLSELQNLQLDSSQTRTQPSKVVDVDREFHQSHPFDLLPLILSWTDPVPEFIPSDERLPIPFTKLPNEVIVYILTTFVQNVDATSIERFALACKKMRTLTLDGSIWRKFLEISLVPNQLSEPDLSIDELCFGLYKSDYRRMFIEYPRIRFDGVYIAICHYIRNGLAENPWVAISHLITYRRFLRFFPNGKVLSYQANEDQEISEVVHSLQPSLAKKDVRLGDWQLLGSWLYITNLADVVPSRFRNLDKFNFQMRLNLKSRPCLGRWNKLDILEYESVDVETGDVSPFALRHERPYWFSKVRSYAF